MLAIVRHFRREELEGLAAPSIHARMGSQDHTLSGWPMNEGRPLHNELRVELVSKEFGAWCECHGPILPAWRTEELLVWKTHNEARCLGEILGIGLRFCWLSTSTGIRPGPTTDHNGRTIQDDQSRTAAH